MKIEQYRCDVCGTLKGETNHWWKVQCQETFDSNVKKDLLTAIHIYPADEFTLTSKTPNAPAWDLCGQRCVTAKVSELMGAAR